MLLLSRINSPRLIPNLLFPIPIEKCFPVPRILADVGMIFPSNTKVPSYLLFTDLAARISNLEGRTASTHSRSDLVLGDYRLPLLLPRVTLNYHRRIRAVLSSVIRHSSFSANLAKSYMVFAALELHLGGNPPSR
jgi:hypothetical protein